MKIGLWSDNHNFPSLPLMKISAYHKQLGDDVEMLNYLKHYDKVDCSKVFSYTPDVDEMCVVNADEIQRGGTGYCISLQNGKEVFDKNKNNQFPKEIENICPDYSLYPQYDFAYGFLTRGCPRGCGFCVVGKKEGLRSHQVAELNDFIAGRHNVKLMDANLLACADHERILQQMIASKAAFDINQGFDARLLTVDNIALINQLKIRMIHFAWDNPRIDLTDRLLFYNDHGVIKDRRRKTVYILANYDSSEEEDLYRISTVARIGYSPYLMVYDKAHAPRSAKMMQRYVNNKIIFNSCTWDQYKNNIGKDE